MTTKSDPVYPVPGTLCEGLTKHEIFAMVAMQGLLASPHRKGDLEHVANESVTAANFLVAVLNSRHD